MKWVDAYLCWFEAWKVIFFFDLGCASSHRCFIDFSKMGYGIWDMGFCFMADRCVW